MTPSRPEIEVLIRATAEQYGVDPDKSIRQCETESSFNPLAVNPRSGCTGLFQVSPKTAEVDLKVSNARVALKDWRINIDAGLKYMRILLRRYDGDYAKAYAAYNWGLGNLDRLIKQRGDAWPDHLPTETKNYLHKILSA